MNIHIVEFFSVFKADLLRNEDFWSIFADESATYAETILMIPLIDKRFSE